MPFSTHPNYKFGRTLEKVVMKKIMFSDKYGLTQAVLDGKKTMTRRIIPNVDIIRHFNPRFFPDNRDPSAYYRDWRGMCRLIDTEGNYILPKYGIGEILAIAQPYKNINEYLSPMARCMIKPFGSPMEHPGWNNKMFVSSGLMPHHIEITDIKAELLQKISDEDCFAEGVEKWIECCQVTGIMENRGRNNVCFNTPREAFACLIDRICGKGTWNSNPFVFAYTFNLVG